LFLGQERVLDLVRRNEGESFDAYGSRLYAKAKEYGLTSVKIAEVLNAESGRSCDESAWRKYYTAFNRGREFERNLAESVIAERILCISDLHVPFQLPKETFSDYVGVIDTLVINGDLIDMQALSRFDKCYRQSPMDEIILGRSYVISLLDYLQPKEVYVTRGNHDLRFGRYLSKNLESDITELMPQTPLELIFTDGFYHYDKQNHTKVWYDPIINVFPEMAINYSEDWHCQVGNTIFCHPIAFKSGIMKTSNDAMTWFRNEGYSFTSLVMAHTHRLGEYVVGNTTLFEQGACCHTEKMLYTDGKLTNSQKQGFLYLTHDKGGNVLRDFSRLVCLN